MKKLLFLVFIIVVLSTRLMASGYAFWNLTSSIPNTLSFTTSSALCPGVQLAVTFDFDAGTPPPTTDEFRFHIEVNNGAGFYSGDNITPTISLPITFTKRHIMDTVLVPITKWLTGGPGEFQVVIEHRVYDTSTYTYGPWTISDVFYPIPASVYPRFTIINDNSNFDFAVNGQKPSGNGDIPTIVRCNNEEIKIDNITGIGEGSSVTTKLEEGTLDGSDFHPLSGRLVFANYGGWQPMFTLSSGVFAPFWVGYLSTGPTYLRATVTVTGPCGVTTKTMLFKVIDANAFVDFQMTAGSTCSATGVAKKTTLPIPDDPAAATGCLSGWQGASSAGIVSFNTVGTTGIVTSYNVRIEEVDVISGTPLSLISDQTVHASLPLNYFFATATSGYFNDPSRYPILTGSNHTFKATLTINTASCSATAFSYFRIIPGSRFLRGSNDINNLATSIGLPEVYPNPSNGKLTIGFTNFNVNGTMVIYNALGKLILTKPLPANAPAELDISYLPAGLYLYKITAGSDIFHGKINKE